MTYVPTLDGLRGLAIMAVLLVHCPYSNRYFSGGWVGVDLFFVLSGFLITTILTGEYEAAGTINLKRFYWRRVLRLYPALIACVLLAGIIVYWGGLDRFSAGYTRAAGAALFYVANVVDFGTKPIDQTWSLAVEEQFYLVWPILLLWFVLKFKLRARLVMVAALIGLAAGSRIVLNFYQVAWWHLYTWPFTRADSLMFGAFVAFASSALVSKLKYLVVPASLFLVWVLLSQDHLEAWVTTCGLTVVGMACAILVAAAVTKSPVRGGSALIKKINVLIIPFGGAMIYAALWAEKAPIWINVIICAIVAGGLGTAIILNERAKEGLLELTLNTKILRWIGKRSYGIYLYHVPLFMALGNTSILAKIDSPWGRPALALAQFSSVFFIAWLSYKFLEAPILALKERKT